MSGSDCEISNMHTVWVDRLDALMHGHRCVSHRIASDLAVLCIVPKPILF